MLSATANTRLLKKAVRACNAFLNETRVRISEEGIAIKAVDAGNICLRKKTSKLSELRKESSE